MLQAETLLSLIQQDRNRQMADRDRQRLVVAGRRTRGRRGRRIGRVVVRIAGIWLLVAGGVNVR